MSVEQNVLIGKRIRNKRIELGIAQEELARKVGYKDNTTLSNIEKGKTKIPGIRLADIAKVLGVTVEYFTSDLTMEESRRIAEIILRLKEDDYDIVELILEMNNRQKNLLRMYCDLLLKKE